LQPAARAFQAHWQAEKSFPARTCRAEKQTGLYFATAVAKLYEVFCFLLRPWGRFFCAPTGEKMGNTGGKSEKRWWNRGKKLLFLCRRAMMNAKWAYYDVPWEEAL
jgi:hypothetical protein